MPDVGRHEEPVRFLRYQSTLDAGRGGAPDGQAAVAVVVVDEGCDRRLAAHEPGGGAVAEPFRHLGQREADLPEPGEHVVGHDRQSASLVRVIARKPWAGLARWAGED